jgi:hypothetical protein
MTYDYELKFPAHLDATRLMGMLEKTASKIGWNYKKEITGIEVDQTPSNLNPTRYKVTLRTDGTLISADIYPEITYGGDNVLKMSSRKYPLTQKNLKDFTETLYGLLYEKS